MTQTYQQSRASQIQKIQDTLPPKSLATLKAFTGFLYAKTSVEDLWQINLQRAAAIAINTFDFIQTRKKHTPKIRIFVPDEKRDGYDSKNTVIELLNDDMPFLVDSLTAELVRQGFQIRETIHPVLSLTRDANGKFSGFSDKGPGESLIHFQVAGHVPEARQKQLEKDLQHVLKYVRASVEDWHKIEDKARERINKLTKGRVHFDRDTLREGSDFLHWLLDRNFVFLGYAEYDFFDDKGREALRVVPKTALGILRIGQDEGASTVAALPPELRHFLLVPKLIEISKSSHPSVVHRNVPMDYIGIKRFDEDGNVVGEARFLGLFTSNVYYQGSEAIPFLRQKVVNVLERTGFTPGSHDWKSLKTILEFLPRDEVFQMDEDLLFEFSLGVLALEAKPRVRMFVRRDGFERFVSLMIFVPREQFSTELRLQIQNMVEKAFNGSVSSFSTQITEARLSRLHLIVKTSPGDIPAVNVPSIERDIAKCAYMWSELLYDALVDRYGETQAERWHPQYEKAFPQNYINVNGPLSAAYDIEKIEAALGKNELTLDLFRDSDEPQEFVHLKIYNPTEQIPLSDILPVLENAGFHVIEENPFLIDSSRLKAPVWIRDFKLKIDGSSQIDFDKGKRLLEDAMHKVWHGTMENDRLNALIIQAGLDWRQVTVLRAYAKYAKQIAYAYNQTAIEQALIHYPQIAKHLVALFEARFDPKQKNHDTMQMVHQSAIEEQLSDVHSATDDSILRRFMEWIMATQRTNYFQSGKPVVSFKFASQKIPDLPKPRPFAEIFVYGMRVEGIHLRGGKVARGGLRWSDRHEDFRTEVLGLMKAQMVKNSVIVPVGSKGGFVVKRPPAGGGREAFMEEGIACYKQYLSGLLDITDNIVKGKVVPPKDTVRHDEDDPYLVVAADKGTATFSDIANGVSADYGFWLGDAFASGGSVGYDHKAMGITARGGWVSVERHFQEMGVDIDQEDFTVAGIGDMSGDVFGNGMLLSKHIRLVAAFNHMHIFIDPNPDAKTSFAERQRLFKLPRSGWKDYDPKLISTGGGVYDRSAKTIQISKQAQAVLGADKTKFTPEELIQTILLAPVDLLWNGGIGTYVKSTGETHEEVGDRANNGLRVNGEGLRCKIVGEGGNLGFTQKGRIEYARTGGRINTDAIDNSAGVDCSDHEVNIKIALSQKVASGKLTQNKRNQLLESMTDDVAYLVLRDNMLQTLAISIAQAQGTALLDGQIRLIHGLEHAGLLDRKVEFLPNDKALDDLKTSGSGLTRPELAVLLAYSKMWLYRELLESDFPDQDYVKGDLQRYFPDTMVSEHPDAIDKHPLRREIIATVATNSLVNRAGCSYYHRMSEDLRVPVRDVAAAYTVTRDAYGLRSIWDGTEQIQATLDLQVQAEIYAQATRFLERVTGWLLRNLPLPLEINHVAEELIPAVEELRAKKQSYYSDAMKEHVKQQEESWRVRGVPKHLGEHLAELEMLVASPDIIAVAHKNAMDIAGVARIYFGLQESLGLSWIHQSASRLHGVTHWERLALQTLSSELQDEQRRITDSAATTTGGMEAWLDKHKAAVKQLSHFMAEMRATGSADLAKLTIVLGQVKLVG